MHYIPVAPPPPKQQQSSGILRNQQQCVRCIMWVSAAPVHKIFFASVTSRFMSLPLFSVACVFCSSSPAEHYVSQKTKEHFYCNHYFYYCALSHSSTCPHFLEQELVWLFYFSIYHFSPVFLQAWFCTRENRRGVLDRVVFLLPILKGLCHERICFWRLIIIKRYFLDMRKLIIAVKSFERP